MQNRERKNKNKIKFSQRKSKFDVFLRGKFQGSVKLSRCSSESKEKQLSREKIVNIKSKDKNIFNRKLLKRPQILKIFQWVPSDVISKIK